MVFAPVQLFRTQLRESFDELVMEALDFLKHLRAKYTRVHTVIGHSLGGLIALRMALLDQDSRY